MAGGVFHEAAFEPSAQTYECRGEAQRTVFSCILCLVVGYGALDIVEHVVHVGKETCLVYHVHGLSARQEVPRHHAADHIAVVQFLHTDIERQHHVGRQFYLIIIDAVCVSVVGHIDLEFVECVVESLQVFAGTHVAHMLLTYRCLCLGIFRHIQGVFGEVLEIAESDFIA